ncbi:MAG: toll/interleukin-1 receptor domain-containing protein [Gammaproteobacteria bacterium]
MSTPPLTGERREHLVFVSHSGADTWVAKQIAREVATCGATPFLDEAEIDVGADFEEDILAFLEKADELVVLITPWALERPYVWAELGAAWGRRIPIVGLLHGLSAAELQSRPGVPILLKRRDLLPLNDIDVYLGQLRGRVGGSPGAIPERT